MAHVGLGQQAIAVKLLGAGQVGLRELDLLLVLVDRLFGIEYLHIEVGNLLLDGEHRGIGGEVGNLSVDFGQLDVVFGRAAVEDRHRGLEAVVAAVGPLASRRHHLAAIDHGRSLAKRGIAALLACGGRHGGQAAGLGIGQVEAGALSVHFVFPHCHVVLLGIVDAAAQRPARRFGGHGGLQRVGCLDLGRQQQGGSDDCLGDIHNLLVFIDANVKHIHIAAQMQSTATTFV